MVIPATADYDYVNITMVIPAVVRAQVILHVNINFEAKLYIILTYNHGYSSCCTLR